jgi:hypothetical protein
VLFVICVVSVEAVISFAQTRGRHLNLVILHILYDDTKILHKKGIMSFFHLPHPPIAVSNIRVNDIWFLLFVGAAYEFGCRLYVLLFIKLKPNTLLRKEHHLKQLTIRTNHLRKLGPSKFVETSKLERQVLALEKELSAIYEQRKR